MAAPRLPFLWPMLFKPSTRGCAVGQPESSFQSASRPRRGRRQFTTTPRWSEGKATQRYGKAQDPVHPIRDLEATKESEKEGKATVEKSAQEHVSEQVEENAHVPTPTTTPTPSKASAIEDTRPPQLASNPPMTGDPNPLDSVLHMPSPQDEEQYKLSHLKTPPYVHHFDTYGLVRELARNSAYTSPQSITIMKAVRQLLLDNMTLAREGLVSKSNVENETYLFRAACSELKTEIGNTRKGENERMRTERNQLQHEVDILGQRLGQETGGLRDELKGLFDDRKMAVRQEQRSMETKIQELNYKITVALNSDARSEVEGLRWVLTRRAAITVGVSAFMLFVALRYTSYIQHQQLEERKKAPPHRPSPMEDFNDSAPRPPTDPNSPTGQQEALGGELLATEGVSLG
ncbi:uncharacterized protein K460DRAFT_310878 [Cucurbitaria berberidis CBS 394.84]|uniref:MOZ protein represents a chromatin-associated acetyltransferase n=1 Tax=Cucurbitaria berberidis CBS 394.84 TaxID=1168544 RepID=A0A9P4GGQ2_9PLEO|nr:uncharacterized protein K460DRAFT_310878 [Cucurbitaria berberidis CBS 394.84]KAF1844914.1 hypothetical protein K460DRAFT_310878 [Cucurbitaria berberidis CBS 394.84]